LRLHGLMSPVDRKQVKLFKYDHRLFIIKIFLFFFIDKSLGNYFAFYLVQHSKRNVIAYYIPTIELSFTKK
jgi:hypothetical protein